MSRASRSSNYYVVSPQVTTRDGRPAGQIRKQFSGVLKEVFTDADIFGVTFPMDLDVHVKATMLGAVFLIVSTCAFTQLKHVHVLVM